MGPAPCAEFSLILANTLALNTSRDNDVIQDAFTGKDVEFLQNADITDALQQDLNAVSDVDFLHDLLGASVLDSECKFDGSASSAECGASCDTSAGDVLAGERAAPTTTSAHVSAAAALVVPSVNSSNSSLPLALQRAYPSTVGLTRAQRVKRWKAKRARRVWTKPQAQSAERSCLACKRKRIGGRFTPSSTRWVSVTTENI